MIGDAVHCVYARINMFQWCVVVLWFSCIGFGWIIVGRRRWSEPWQWSSLPLLRRGNPVSLSYHLYPARVCCYSTCTRIIIFLNCRPKIVPSCFIFWIYMVSVILSGMLVLANNLPYPWHQISCPLFSVVCLRLQRTLPFAQPFYRSNLQWPPSPHVWCNHRDWCRRDERTLL